MNELTNKAIAKITDEMMAINTRNAIAIEEYLTNKCKSDEIANRILAEGKTLNGCIEHCKKKARPQSKKGCAMITAEEVYEWVDEYYGVAGIEAANTEVIDIMSLL